MVQKKKENVEVYCLILLLISSNAIAFNANKVSW